MIVGIGVWLLDRPGRHVARAAAWCGFDRYSDLAARIVRAATWAALFVPLAVAAATPAQPDKSPPSALDGWLLAAALVAVPWMTARAARRRATMVRSTVTFLARQDTAWRVGCSLPVAAVCSMFLGGYAAVYCVADGAVEFAVAAVWWHDLPPRERARASVLAGVS